MDSNSASELCELLALTDTPTTFAVIVSVTTDCVLSCRYCFARSPQPCGCLDNSMLEYIVREAFETRHSNVSFEWTGGEPLLAGQPFFERVVALQKRYSTKHYVNYVQTSGALHDFDLMEYLVQNGFRLSLTIDGPPEIHDAHRPLANGRGSYEAVITGFHKIRQLQGKCGFISTVTKLSLGHEADMLEHFRSLDVDSFHSNPYILDSGKHIQSRDIALEATDYASYLVGQFGAWLDSGRCRPVPVVLDALIGGIAGASPPSSPLCTLSGRCLGNFAAIAPSGHVYPCPKMMSYPQTEIGQLGRLPLWAMMSKDNPRMNALMRQRCLAIDSCKRDGCRFRWLCNSGCPYRSFVESGHRGISARDVLCPSILLVAEFLESAVDCFGASQFA